MAADEPDRVIHADNLDVLPTPRRPLHARLPRPAVQHGPQPDAAVDQARAAGRADVAADAPSGTITGFAGKRYERIRGDLMRYDDRFDDYWSFLEPRLAEAWRLLADDGTLYLHLDYREAHYAKVLLDALFGRECFLNELIWAYDYGGKSKRRWPTKHDTILVYVKDPGAYFFDSEAVDREPYMAPGLVTPEKAERGKLPTDVWCTRSLADRSREDGATRRRSPRACCGASCRRRAAPATGCSTRSRARARRAQSHARSVAASCSSMSTPRRSRSCAAGSRMSRACASNTPDAPCAVGFGRSARAHERRRRAAHEPRRHDVVARPRRRGCATAGRPSCSPCPPTAGARS